MASAAIKFYGNKICPFAHRALITAAEKNVPLDYHHVPLGSEKPEWYFTVNPRGTVPAITLPSGKTLLESMFVAQYFDEAHGERNALMPSDPEAAYDARFFIDEFGSRLIRPLYGLLKNQEADKDAEFIKDIEAGLARLNELLEAQGGSGPFLFGEQYTLADIAVVPFLHRFRFTLKHYRDYDLLGNDETKPGLKRLRAWLAAAEARPSLTSTTLAPEEFVSGYTGYAGDRGASSK
eukprot:CAMPEP_0196770266 /NCGR_PEP_ID=MMETSP1104-20130614/1047_1 /TAXON_ID=33652 /ORGANISM="Cafeteria sp., Strain Caron Lab Isolate" /LENGTH=235 /DNA_ID=CAMNT_0042140377 /DNA_START=34 /DNA_END=741 /DNA_ORIENTATION=+